MTKNQAIIKCLPLLASLLGDKYGVRVVLGEKDRPCTDGSTIYLPALPAEASEDFVALVSQYVSHETAHIRYSDFHAISKAKSASKKWILNSLEDYRIEHLMTEKYPGCASQFHKLILHLFDRETVLDFSYPANNILNWILMRLRAWDAPSIENRLIPLERAITKELSPTILGRILPILQDFKDKVMTLTTKDCLVYAGKILSMIRKHDSNTDNNNEQEKQKETNNPKEGTNSENDETETIGNSATDKNDNTSNPNSNKEEADNNDNTTNEQPEPSPFDSLFEDEPILPADFGKMLSDEIYNEIKTSNRKNPQNKISIAIEEQQGGIDMLSEETLKEIETVTAAVRARLFGLLQADTLNGDSPATTGKLNTKALYKLSINDQRIFTRHSEKKQIDTALHLLLDKSSSMAMSMKNACSACHAIVSALQTLGINTAYTAYPYGNYRLYDKPIKVLPLVTHGQKLRKKGYYISANGLTPTSDALLYVVKTMLPLTEQRKIIFIISDGCPDSTEETKRAVEIAKNCGMEVYGLGIGCDCVATYLDSSVAVRNIQELPEKLFQLMSKILIK